MPVVVSNSTIVKTVVVRGPTTLVKSITVGTPIGPINLPGTTLAGLLDVSFDSLNDRDILQFNVSENAWKNVDIRTEIDSNDNALQLQITGNDSDILALQIFDSATADQLAAISSSISGNDSDILALRVDVDQNIFDLTAFQGQIQGNDSDILVLQGQVSTLESRTDSNESWLSDRITNNDSDILAIQNSLNASDSADDAAIADLQAQLDSNETMFRGFHDSAETVREAGDANLQTQLDSNEIMFRGFHDSAETARETADANLQAQLDSNEIMFRGFHDSAETAREADFTAVNARIDSAQVEWRAADADLQNQVDSNETLQKATDASLQTNIDSNATDIEALVSTTASIQGQVDSNESLSKATDASLLASIGTLQGEVDSNELMFRGFLDSAELARLGAEADLQNQIDSNESLSKATDAAILAAIGTLQGEVDSNETLQKATDATLASDLASETTNRSNADSDLQSQLDSNETMFRGFHDSAETAREAADAALSSAISTEVSDRTNADAALQANIDSNAVDIASLQTQVTNNDSDIAALSAGGVDSGQVIAIVQPFLDSNADDISTLNAGQVTLQGNIDSNATDIASLSASTSSLQSQIDSNETLSKATDASLLAQIDSNETLSKATDASLRTSIDSNEAFFKAADATLQANIDALPDSDNFVTLKDAQTIAGVKTFSNDVVVSSIGAITLATGTSGERPTIATGKTRHNTTLERVETVIDDAWKGLAIAGPAKAQHWRLRGVSPGAGAFTGGSIAELEYHAYIGGPDITGSGTPSAGSSFDVSFQPPNAFDDNTATVWAGASNAIALGTSWIAYDFGTEVFVEEFVITARTGSESNETWLGWYLEKSDDGSTWEFVQAYTVASDWTSGQSQIFTVTNTFEIGSLQKQIFDLDSDLQYQIDSNESLSKATDAAILATIAALPDSDNFVTLKNAQTIAGVKTFSDDMILSSSGALTVSSGTTAERPGSPTNGMFRYNEDSSAFEGYVGGEWGPLGGGAVDDLFYENAQSVSADYTILSTRNAMTAGPILIDSGVTVTIDSGGVWTIV